MQRLLAGGLILAGLLAASGCRAASGSTTPLEPQPCTIALTQHQGETPLDREIAQLQQKARTNQQPGPFLEKLGWRLVEKARVSFDPGYYKLAEQCALCIEAKANPNQQVSQRSNLTPEDAAKSTRASVLLLRGHILHSMHRFGEAETMARELVNLRGLAFDYGLLGDVLMEQGKLNEAIVAYQQMMNQRPGPQAYSRAAHVRWLQGDLDGARQLMQMAAQASGQGDAESSAWAWSRAALYELQAGQVKRAQAFCDTALELQKEYAPALLSRGRILLAEQKTNEAIATLQRAAQLNPLPEYQWTLADALRTANRAAEAQTIESKLAAQGEANDPRTYALYLATRGNHTARALKLVNEELRLRQDIYTLDALAWAQAAHGDSAMAWQTMQQALRDGTQDARLFFHAASIAAQAGQSQAATTYRNKAVKLQAMLLPSEQNRLKQLQTG